MLKAKATAVKKHVEEHCFAYIAVTGAAVAGITCCIMRGRHAEIPRVSDGPDTVTVRPLSFFSRQENTITTVIEREGRGHPGYRVRCLETGEEFASQGEAARALKALPAIVSGHLKGKVDDVHGHHLERIREV